MISSFLKVYFVSPRQSQINRGEGIFKEILGVIKRIFSASPIFHNNASISIKECPLDNIVVMS